MKERPILFSTPMVQAILAGRKTQTRRVVKKKQYDEGWIVTSPSDGYDEQTIRRDYPCPYGRPGDRLWVRETWQPFFTDGVIYLADAGTHRLNAHSVAAAKQQWPQWKPSIHMPRRLSRIMLEITAVRVERLNQIEYKDCKAEGLQEPRQFAQFGASAAERDELFRVSYKTLWESINGPDSWDKNPWVWVVEFKMVTP